MSARRSAAARLVVAGGLVAMYLANPAMADSEPAAERDDPRALALLAAAQAAPATVGYVGVQYVSAWGPGGAASQVIDVTHVPKVGTVVAVRGTATTPAGESFAQASGEASATTPGAVTEGPVALLAGNYELVVAGTESVAGRRCMLVEARRADGGLSARFWLDEATGLMLRREVFDHDGRVIKASAFVDITLGAARLDQHLPPAMPSIWADRPAAEVLREGGWLAPERVRPGLALYDVRTQDTPTGPIVHLSYSDGLSTVSVFQQHGHLDASGLAGYREADVGGATIYVYDGIPYRATWSSGGVVYTVFADAPEEVALAVIEDLPKESSDDGVIARVGRGIGRVASWFNPFG